MLQQGSKAIAKVSGTLLFARTELCGVGRYTLPRREWGVEYFDTPMEAYHEVRDVDGTVDLENDGSFNLLSRRIGSVGIIGLHGEAGQVPLP